MIMKLMKIIVTILITMMMKIVIGRMISKHSGAVELCILQELVISQWHNQCICSQLYRYCIDACYCDAQVAQPMHLLSTVSALCMHFTVPLRSVHFALMHKLHKQCICIYTLLQCTASALKNIYNVSTLYCNAVHLFCAELKCALEYFRSAGLTCSMHCTWALLT